MHLVVSQGVRAAFFGESVMMTHWFAFVAAIAPAWSGALL
jgi:hypothetical protein